MACDDAKYNACYIFRESPLDAYLKMEWGPPGGLIGGQQQHRSGAGQVSARSMLGNTLSLSLSSEDGAEPQALAPDPLLLCGLPETNRSGIRPGGAGDHSPAAFPGCFSSLTSVSSRPTLSCTSQNQ